MSSPELIATGSTRRQFLGTTLAGAAALAACPLRLGAADSEAFSFVLLGDLHFDKLEHHDLAWIEKNKGGDLGQIQNYSRITKEMMPDLFRTVQQTVAELNRAPETRVAFVLQVGDLVEGLCGNETLAAQQNREAVEFVRSTALVAPFLFIKGNHEVTGGGAPAAFNEVLLPWMREQARGFESRTAPTGACYAVEHANALFCGFDAYDAASLDWLEAAFAQRTAQHCFVMIHPPVVPYGARATWHIYAKENERSRREKLLEMLGNNHAFVLGGHIHKFSALLRRTSGKGKFAQLAVSSVIKKPPVKARTVLSGLAEYNGDQVRVEPTFSPETETQRRAILDAERPFVGAFDYADVPGYAVVTVKGAAVEARIYAGPTRQLWRTVSLSEMLAV